MCIIYPGIWNCEIATCCCETNSEGRRLRLSAKFFRVLKNNNNTNKQTKLGFCTAHLEAQILYLRAKLLVKVGFVCTLLHIN